MPRWILLSLVLAATLLVARARETFSFNSDWRLHVGDPAGASAPEFPDASWKQVTLPRAWNEDSAFRESIYDLPTGIAWYRKHFVLPPGSEGKTVLLEFDGVRQGAEFFLNGESLGLHEDGITAVGFDISTRVLPSPRVNVLAVRTDNAWDYRERATGQRFQWNDRNFNANYGGIPKHVRLHIAATLHQTLPVLNGLGTTGVYIHADAFDLEGGSATLHVASQVRNRGTSARAVRLEVSIASVDGTQVAAFSSPAVVPFAAGDLRELHASARVSGLKWWTWGRGHLYDVTTRLVDEAGVVDTVVTRTGFRKTEFRDGMVWLNGRVLQMKGYAQRTSNEWPALGMSVPAWLSDFSNGLMVESGANLVRWMHIAPWRQDVESCDRVGLLQAVPAGDAEKDVDGRRWEQRVEVMRATIVSYRNNPSVLFWECGNNGISEAHMEQMRAVRDLFDPQGGRAIGSRDMLGSRAAEYGGEMLYINKSARVPFWAMEYSRDEGLRKYWDEFSPPFHKNGDGPPHKGQPGRAWNHNQDSHALENVRRWYDYWSERPGTARRVSSGGVNIIFSDSNTHFRGAENYRRSGEVDAMRLPKDGFFAHRVMWEGWVDVERPRAHLLGHWNYATGVVKPVHVVSSAESVELRLNGRVLGRSSEPQARFAFTFPDVAWEPGVLEAIGYDREGREVCRDRRETTGPASALRLTVRTAPDGLGFKADGADVALLQIEVVDASGRRVPVALDPVRFTVDGPAEWRGGIAQGPRNHILDTNLPVEGGVNRALLRSTVTPGTVRVRAEAEGLVATEVTLEAVAVSTPASPGLGGRLPGAGLAPQLLRDAPPADPSFRVSRRTVRIASVEAGSETASAAAAFDDNEETSWEGGGDSGQAWIAFTFEQPARPTALTARFAGFRSRAYPIQVLVDGRVVYRGVTRTSLGYITLPLVPVEGRVVRLELVGRSEADSAFGAITELANAANASDRAPVANGTLGISEIEFLEDVP